MEIYLIRHAESDSNISKLIQDDSKDCWLSPAGSLQARELSKWAHQQKFSFVVSSPMKRALQTSQEILLPGQLVEISKPLSEIDKGFKTSISQGVYTPDCTFEEWLSTTPDSWKNIHFTYSNGESVNEMRDRVFPEFKRIIEKGFNQSAQKICIVSHNWPIKAILTTLNSTFESDYFNLHIPNASIWKIHADRNVDWILFGVASQTKYS
jgi:broad specificity phosphatase PhoE